MAPTLDWKAWLSLGVFVVQNGCSALIMRYAKTVAATNGATSFSSTVVVFVQEFMFKLPFCATAYMVECGGVVAACTAVLTDIKARPSEWLQLAVPALLYTVQNTMIYVGYANLEAAIGMVTYQTKILFTAVFSVVLLRKRLSQLQWLSLAILFIGVLCVQGIFSGNNNKSAGRALQEIGLEALDVGGRMLAAAAATDASLTSRRSSSSSSSRTPKPSTTKPHMAGSGGAHHGTSGGTHVATSLGSGISSGGHHTVEGIASVVSAHEPSSQHYGRVGHTKDEAKRAHHYNHFASPPSPATGAAAPPLLSAPTQNPTLGVLAFIIAAVCTSFASVYFEKMIKGDSKPSLWLRNCQLAFYSSVIALIAILLQPGGLSPPGGLFAGFGPYAWFSAIWQAFGGIIVAVTIKYADNILRGFAQALAIIVGAIGSCFLFGFILTPAFMLGVALVISAVFLYGANAQTPTELCGSCFNIA